MVIVILLILCNSSQAQEKHKLPIIEKNVCPFECCQYGKWITHSPLKVYKSEGDTSLIIYNFAPGDSFISITGDSYIERYGVVTVTKPIGTYVPGDSLLILSYTGEGYFDVEHKGKIQNVEMFWFTSEDIDSSMIDLDMLNSINFSGELVIEPIMYWWVKVSLPKGGTGWIRFLNTTNNGFSTEERIEGRDGCS